MTSTCGNSSAMSTALSHPNQYQKSQHFYIRFDLLTKVHCRCPCPAHAISLRPYRDPGTALSPRVPRKFYSRIQIGPSCETARSAERWPMRALSQVKYKSIVIRPQGEQQHPPTYPHFVFIRRHHISVVQVVAPPATDDAEKSFVVVRSDVD